VKPFIAAVCALWFAVAAPGRASAEPLLVFAAASMKTALDEVAGRFSRDAKRPMPRLSYAGTPALARQVEQGAPVDVFISADADWMNYLQTRALIRPETRIDLLGNRIVLVGPRTSASVSLDKPEEVARALGAGRLAIADVNTAPAGKYGKAALEKLGLWGLVRNRLAQTENVRAALLFVSRGEAPLGLVYQTDAAADPLVRVVASFPQDSHPPIIYPAAVTRASTNPDAAPFLAFLQGPQAMEAFRRHGFTSLKPAD
jgi:molybdate transport system substrate-binding protein